MLIALKAIILIAVPPHRSNFITVFIYCSRYHFIIIAICFALNVSASYEKVGISDEGGEITEVFQVATAIKKQLCSQALQKPNKYFEIALKYRVCVYICSRLF